MQEIQGPVEYLIIGFEGNKFKGEIIPALTQLLDQGLIRILDLAVISKDAEGNVLLFEPSELMDDASLTLAEMEGEHDDMLSEDDLLLAAEELDNNTTAAAMLFENVWAGRFAQAVRNAGGEVFLNERIPHATVVAVQQALLAAD